MKAFKAGVYLLFDRGEVVYVGQSKNPMYRIGTHIQEGVKEFDQYLVYETEEYNDLEAFLINALKPKYNISVPSNDGCFPEIKRRTIEDLCYEMPLEELRGIYHRRVAQEMDKYFVGRRK